MRKIGHTNYLPYTPMLTILLLLSLAAGGQTWTARSAVAINGNVGGYYEYLPAGYNDQINSSKNYPLLVFLHGLGELGNGSSDLGKILYAGLPQYINQGKFPSSFIVNGTEFRFIVICPQFIGWPGAGDVEAVVNYASQKYRVDASRIYVTGLSMGGGATWEYAGNNATYASKVAAIVPVCGASWPDINRCKVMATANLPVWATHNDGDGTVALSNTNGYVDGINSFNPAIKAQKTIWQSWGHDAWTKTYDPTYKLDGTRNCYEWMLQYTRGAAPPPPAVTAWISSKSDLTCNGAANGSATVGASGGVAPYTYSWNTSPVQTGSTASNLPAGNFTVTVKDANNSTATATVTISEPAKLSLNVSAGTISSAGGSTNVTVSASGGTAPYSYTGPTSNVTAGTYTYTVTDAKGCKDTKTITITDPVTIQPPPPPASTLAISIVGSTSVSCYGGSNGTASVTVTGGTTPYSYSWNSNPAQSNSVATNLAAGIYTVQVKDATGATVSTTVTVTQPELLQLQASSGTINTLGGTTSVALTATGGTAPYTYEGNVNNLTAGTYNFGVTDAMGCKASTSITITESLVRLKGRYDPIKCKGGKTSVSLTAEGGQAPYIFQGQTNNLEAGTYTFSVIDAKGAKGSLTLSITEPEALALAAKAGTITKIGGTTNILLEASGGTNPYSYSGPTTDLKAGSYQYRVTDNNGCQSSTSVELKEPGVKLSAFTLATVDTVIKVRWRTDYEYGIDRFEVEKSKEDKAFTTLEQVRSKNSVNGNSTLDYESADMNTIQGANSYRLYAVTIFGEKVLLAERNYFFDEKGTAAIKNLTDRIEISLTSAKEEKVYITLYDAAGRPLRQMQEMKNVNLYRTTIPMNSLPKGYYVVRLMTSSGLVVSKQVVKP